MSSRTGEAGCPHVHPRIRSSSNDRRNPSFVGAIESIITLRSNFYVRPLGVDTLATILRTNRITSRLLTGLPS